MILHQFYLNCLAHASYVVGDEESRIAAVVDPQRDIDQYLAFVDAHQKEYSKLPDVFAVQAWDGMRAFDEAVKALKGETSDKQKLIRALEDVKFNSPRGAFEFDKDTHNVIHDMYIRQVQQQAGKYVNVIIDKVGRVTDPGK